MLVKINLKKRAIYLLRLRNVTRGVYTPYEARLDDVGYFYEPSRGTVEQRVFIRDSLIGLLPRDSPLILTKISDEHEGIAHGRSRSPVEEREGSDDSLVAP